MELLDFEKFLEKKLEIRDLKNDQRIESFVNRILRGSVVLNNDTEVRIDEIKLNGNWISVQDVNAEELKNFIKNDAPLFFKGGRRLYQAIFKNDNVFYKLTDFKKTKDLGQRGPGANTNEKEEITSLYIDMFQLIRTPDLSKVKFDEYMALNRIPDHLHIKNTITWEKINSYTDWTISFINAPRGFWRKFGESNIVYDIYHIGFDSNESPSKILKKKYYELLENRKIDFNKFCPADVYLVDNKYIKDILYAITSTKTIEDLVDLMNEMFDKKILIPISLKKSNIVGDKFIINNFNGLPSMNFSRISFDVSTLATNGISSKIKTTSRWLNELDSYESRNIEMTIDSSNTSKNVDVDGEVKVISSSSRTGKISLNNINDILSTRDIIPEGIKNYKFYRNMSTEQLLDILNDNYNNLIGNCNIVNRVLTGRDISNDKNSLISKIQSLEILTALNYIRRENMESFNVVIEQMFKHALSIQTIQYVSPKYYRLI